METQIELYYQTKAALSTRLAVPFQRPTLPVLIILMLFLLAGCGAINQSVLLPPVTQTYTAKIHDGHFVWIDLVTEDVVAAASFYSRLFGWRAARSNENEQYYLFYLGSKPVAGMAASENKDTAAPESLWLATISVGDVDTSVASVKANGGMLLGGPLDAVGRGRMALVSDPAEAPFIILGAGSDSPVGRKAKIGQWHWIDLVTQDGNRAKDFYTAVFGFQVKPVEAGKDHQYDLFILDKRAVAGLVELEWEGLEDNWLPHFKVADVDQIIASARNLGGKLILQSGKVAVLTDPTGAAFGIQMR